MSLTIQQAINQWIKSVGAARSANTRKTYRSAGVFFSETLKENNLPPAQTPITKLDHRAIVWLCDDLKRLSPTSERLYLTAIRKFYKYLTAHEIIVVNNERINDLIGEHARRVGRRIVQFDMDAVKLFIDRVARMKISHDMPQRLIDLRDKAFILTLKDTGARVSEAVGELKRGNIDWKRKRVVIIGKGDKQAVIRFTDQSLNAIKAYLRARSELDGASGVPLNDLPIFARHDHGAGTKILPITPQTAQKRIIKARLKQLLKPDERARITPHTFRHYSITVVYQLTHDLKTAANHGRHSNIQMTDHYTHLVDDEMDAIHEAALGGKRK